MRVCTCLYIYIKKGINSTIKKKNTIRLLYISEVGEKDTKVLCCV